MESFIDNNEMDETAKGLHLIIRMDFSVLRDDVSAGRKSPF